MICNFYPKVKQPFSQQFIKKIINQTAKLLKINSNQEITVLLVGDKKIRSLNKKYKNKDKVTDVLSFSQKEGEAIVLPGKEDNYLGDIVICYPQAKRQAKKYKHSVKKELSWLLVHGFLHLLGYKDETKAAYLKMKKAEDRILEKLNH